MLQVDTYLDNSPIHGIGLFSKVVIAPGEFVWKFEPAFDKRITAVLADHLMECQKRELYQRCYINPDWPDVLVLCGDAARFMNFSNTPNLICSPITDQGEHRLIALCEIRPGDELTVGSETDFDYLRKMQFAEEMKGG